MKILQTIEKKRTRRIKKNLLFNINYISWFCSSKWITKKRKKFFANIRLFSIFVWSLFQILRQNSSMKNRWNWIDFIVLLRFCVKFYRWKIDEIDYISSFCSSKWITKSEKNSSRKYVYFLFSFRICDKFCVRIHQWEIDEIEYISTFCLEFVSKSIDENSMKNRWNFRYFNVLFRICVKFWFKIDHLTIDDQSLIFVHHNKNWFEQIYNNILYEQKTHDQSRRVCIFVFESI